MADDKNDEIEEMSAKEKEPRLALNGRNWSMRPRTLIATAQRRLLVFSTQPAKSNSRKNIPSLPPRVMREKRFSLRLSFSLSFPLARGCASAECPTKLVFRRKTWLDPAAAAPAERRARALARVI